MFFRVVQEKKEIQENLDQEAFGELMVQKVTKENQLMEDQPIKGKKENQEEMVARENMVFQVYLAQQVLQERKETEDLQYVPVNKINKKL